MRKAPKVTIYAGVTLILFLLPLFLKGAPYYLHICILAFIYIIATSSLRLVFTSGQLSLGHAGFMSIGAYTSGLLARDLGWTPWATILLGGVAAMAVAILIGFPFTRLRAFYFSLVSLFFGAGILAVNQVFEKYTGGYIGIKGIPPLFSGISKIPNYYFFLILAVLCLLAMYRIEFSRIGVTFKAIAQSYSVASSVGINEAGHRVVALAMGSFFVGIAGASYAHYNSVLSHEMFSILPSIYLVVYMLVGGVGNFSGPIIGTAVLIIIPELFRVLRDFVPYIFGGIMLIVVYVMPQGLTGLPHQIRAWWGERRREKAVTHAS
jgi:branched-chain amino acid transport system permease protein